MFIQQIINPIVYAIINYSYQNAFCIQNKLYTYKELGECIAKIRKKIIQTNKEELFFGLVCNDDLETYASIIALWIEGKAYVPLHSNQPLDRCINIINQMDITCILDSSVNSRYYVNNVINTCNLEKTDFVQENFSKHKEKNPAYILFTSGSTGTPKGVIISRENLGAFMDSFWRTGINITENDRCLQCFDLTFDVSIQSFLVALTRGACVYTVPYNQNKYIYVASLIDSHKITFGAMAPSMIRLMQPYFNEIDASSVKTTILTAEACPLFLLEAWAKCAFNSDIYDFYGPTEATIYCTFYKWRKNKINKSSNGIVSIGRAMHHIHAFIIDENKNLLSSEEKGELCISGKQLTPGYWNDEQKNEQVFFEINVNNEKLRLYHTGDLCFKDEEGDIMYIGRMDTQIKIQGYRVELGEIEYYAREFLQDANAVVLAYTNKEKITQMALFVESEKADNEGLMCYLRSKLPSYMIPHHIIHETSFPLNSNGKIDKLKLKEKLKTYE
ncbi:MAG TPA: AMP-binding protein [Bacteroidales bacterium]|nr:AMP-binding protein [Bacteroidales bacterium]